MKLSKITKLALPLLVALTMTAACGGSAKTEMTDQEIVDAVSKTGALVINGNTGTPYSDPSITQHVTDGDFLIVTKYVNYADKYAKDEAGNPIMKKVTIVNSMDTASAAKWTYNARYKDSDGVLKEDKGKYTLAGELKDSFNSTLTAVLTYGSATKTIAWTITYTPIEYQSMNLEDVRTTKPKAGSYIDTVGYITKGFTKGDIYAGAFIASGEQALMLYAGNLSSLWSSLSLAEGDLVRVKAQYAPYNGLTEIKPTSITKLEAVPAGFKVNTPVDLEITEGSQWSLTGLSGQDSRVTNCRGLVYKGLDSGEKLSIGSHWNIYFELDAVEIVIRVNYHIGSEEQTKIRNLIQGWTVRTSKVDFAGGVLSWYNGPQLQPVLASNIVAA